jgi:hypothetical protein
MSEHGPLSDRRTFLKVAAVLTAGAATTGCQLESHPPDAPSVSANERVTGFDRVLLDALGDAVLPSELGARERDVAIGQFVAWADAYDPVAEEMHGYGYADVRYLPADPVPAWRAQLTALDLLSRKTKRLPFARLPLDAKRELLTTVLKGRLGDKLPAPLDASHIAIALLAHWASSPDAWDLALGVKVGTGTCRPLNDALRQPLPITGLRA